MTCHSAPFKPVVLQLLALLEVALLDLLNPFSNVRLTLTLQSQLTMLIVQTGLTQPSWLVRPGALESGVRQCKYRFVILNPVQLVVGLFIPA